MTNINSRIKPLSYYKDTKFGKDIKEAFATFIKDNGREPTVIEIDSSGLFPISARQMQRKFGGVKALRRELGLTESFSEGKYRTNTAVHINERGLAVENEMFKFLLENYEPKLIHRQYMYCDDERTRADFCVWDRIPNHRDVIDVFSPKDKHNFVGCLNSKQRKHNSLEQHFIKGTWSVWFVCSNPDFTQEAIDAIVDSKKNPLLSYQRVISYETFKNMFKKDILD